MAFTRVAIPAVATPIPAPISSAAVPIERTLIAVAPALSINVAADAPIELSPAEPPVAFAPASCAAVPSAAVFDELA